MNPTCVIATLVIGVNDLAKFDPISLTLGLAMMIEALEEDGLKLHRIELKIPRDSNNGPVSEC